VRAFSAEFSFQTQFASNAYQNHCSFENKLVRRQVYFGIRSREISVGLLSLEDKGTCENIPGSNSIN